MNTLFCTKGKLKKGMVIVFEGPDGCGKSAQINLAAKTLSEQYNVILTKQPGGTPIGQHIREVVLDKDIKLTPKELALLFSLDRLIHLEKIQKETENGAIVLMDRFQLSTYVYQGYCGDVSLEELNSLYKYIAGNFKPDLTIVFNLPFDVTEKRIFQRAQENAKQKGTSVKIDRFEEKREFLLKVHQGYNNLAADQHYKELFNIEIIDCIKQNNRGETVTKTIEEIADKVIVLIKEKLKNSFR